MSHISAELLDFEVGFIPEGKGKPCIAVGSGTATRVKCGSPVVFVSFQRLVSGSGNIGEAASLDVPTLGPRIRMIFEEPKSIDVVVKFLREAKAKLVQDRKEKLLEKINK